MALSQHFEGNLADIEITNGFNGYECFDDTFDDERAFEMEYEVRFNVQIILTQHLYMTCDKFKLQTLNLHETDFHQHNQASKPDDDTL